MFDLLGLHFSPYFRNGKNAVPLVSVDGRLPIWPRFLRGTTKNRLRNLGQFALLWEENRSNERISSIFRDIWKFSTVSRHLFSSFKFQVTSFHWSVFIHEFSFMRNLEITFNIFGCSVADVPQPDQFIDRAHQNCLLGHNFSKPCDSLAVIVKLAHSGQRVVSASHTSAPFAKGSVVSVHLCRRFRVGTYSLSQRVHMASA